MGVMDGEAVTFALAAGVAEDENGDEVTARTEVTVGGVLVRKLSATESAEGARPGGVTVAATLAIPKSCSADLTGALAYLVDRGEARPYRVVGVLDTPESALRWDRIAEVSATDG